MKFWLLVVVAVTLGACSKNDFSKTPRYSHVSQFEFDPALCTTLKPETGDEAITSDLGLSHPVTSIYFGKPYNRALLEGVLTASGTATQTYVSAAGIELYKVPYAGPSNTCLFQHALPVVPDDPLGNFWDQTAGGDHGGGHLDGLFVAYDDSDGSHQAIMVSEDSSRWTLVHEMMHANFFRERQRLGIPGGIALQNQVRDAFAALQAEYDAYKAAPTSESFEKIVSKTDSVAHLQYQSLQSGSLEEIADESLLLQEWADGHLKFVSDLSAKNAAWYIEFARTISLKDLNAISDFVVKMKSECGGSSVARFQPTLDFIESVNNEAIEHSDKARQIILHRFGTDEKTGLVMAPLLARDVAHARAMMHTPAQDEARVQTFRFQF